MLLRWTPNCRWYGQKAQSLSSATSVREKTQVGHRSLRVIDSLHIRFSSGDNLVVAGSGS